jgi:hypothetical protein
MLSVGKLSVGMLSVPLLSVAMLSVGMLSVVMLSVIILNVVAPSESGQVTFCGTYQVYFPNVKIELSVSFTTWGQSHKHFNYL